MKHVLVIIALALLGACAQLPQKAAAPPVIISHAPPPVPKSFAVEQFELLMIEYKNPTTVTAIDANGPADKIFSCVHAGAAGVAQGDQKGATYVPTCIPVMFKGPIPHGAVAVQRLGSNVHALFWTAFSLDYNQFGVFVKGAQPYGPFPSAAACALRNQYDVKQAYAKGHVAKTDSLIAYCVPILAYGTQANGAEQVDFKLWPGAGGHCFWESELSAPCELRAELKL